MNTRTPMPGAGFVEVGDRCWVARHAYLDVNVGVVAGDRGVLLVDTNTSAAAGRTVLDDLRRLGAGPVLAVLNTHHHYDHVLGNGVVLEEYDAELIAHEDAAALVAAHCAEVAGRADREDPVTAEIAATVPVVPSSTFSMARALDLGDRYVELLHLGRGHTVGDALVRVPDADVVLAGDLVEESAPPSYGDDCYPLDWPDTLDLVLGLLSPGSLVVPGHGAPVDRAFLADQAADVRTVAETVRELAGRGVPADRALAEADWPFPAEVLENAVRRGYAQLPREGRSLPLA